MPDTLIKTMAQANQPGNGSPTPYLDVSEHMGKVVLLCVVLIAVVAVVQKFRKEK
jgi:hypothetical protein